MQYRIASDIHTEFFANANNEKFKRIMSTIIPTTPEDKERVLILSGDVGLYSKWDITYGRTFSYLTKKFKKIIVVPGNHSYYHSDVWGIEEEFLKGKTFPKNVHYFENQSAIINKDTILIGACLWSDFDKENPITIMSAEMGMNDFRLIKKNPSIEPTVGLYSTKQSIRAIDALEKHKYSKQYIIKMLKKACDEGIKNKIVVTHHAPSEQSVDERYKDDSLNGAYKSDLEDIMEEFQVTLWTHGHMHSTNNYKVGNTQVIGNAYGYFAYEPNPKYDRNLMIEI